MATRLHLGGATRLSLLTTDLTAASNWVCIDHSLFLKIVPIRGQFVLAIRNRVKRDRSALKSWCAQDRMGCIDMEGQAGLASLCQCGASSAAGSFGSRLGGAIDCFQYSHVKYCKHMYPVYIDTDRMIIHDMVSMICRSKISWKRDLRNSRFESCGLSRSQVKILNFQALCDSLHIFAGRIVSGPTLRWRVCRGDKHNGLSAMFCLAFSRAIKGDIEHIKDLHKVLGFKRMQLNPTKAARANFVKGDQKLSMQKGITILKCYWLWAGKSGLWLGCTGSCHTFEKAFRSDAGAGADFAGEWGRLFSKMKRLTPARYLAKDS